MKVLILCHDFPPYNSVASQRPFSWFRYFKQNGVEPTVITKTWIANTVTSLEVLRGEYRGINSLQKTSHGTIIRVRSNKILPEKMLVKFGIKPLAFIRRLFTFCYRMFCFTIPFFDRNYSIYKAAEAECKNQKFDFVICTGEPFILFNYAYKLHKKFGIKWVADYRDMWKNNHAARFRNDLLSRVLKWMEWQYERKIIPTATLVTTTESQNAETLEKRHGKKANVIFNGFDDFFKSTKTNPYTEQLILTHTGTLVQGQDIEFLFRAVIELDAEGKITPADITLRFIGLQFYTDQVKRINSFNKNLTPYLQTTPRVTRTQALELNAESDFLIALSDPLYKTIFVKTYDYLSVKKPILVIPDDHALMSKLITDAHAGFCFDSVDQLKNFLLEKIQLKKQHLPLTSLQFDESKVAVYKREYQAKVFCNLLKQTAGIQPD